MRGTPHAHDDFEARFRQASDRWLPAILELIEQVMAESSGGSSLHRMGRYHFSTGGKRLRALLPLLLAEALDSEPEPLLPFGAACEMLHNATLVHDDLQDGDERRRGQPTVWARYGQAQAINLGDAMFYWAVLLLQRLPHSAELRLLASRRLLRETLRVIDGQEREFILKGGVPRRERYFEMVEGKTSGLFSLPLAGAAELCGASPGLVARLEEASRHLGVLFQVQDDVLDLYGEKGREAPGGDILEGKRSLLAVEALRRAPEGPAYKLLSVLDAPRNGTSPEDVRWAIDFIAEVGALDAALDEIERRHALAIEALDGAPPALLELVDGTAALFLRPIRGVLEARGRAWRGARPLSR